ncbi:MAG: SUMF1/EgtB/PvdO family nonheme iron enzyme [Myxococcales bacterium]|nr:SUMF1/EgtB/PvdO family nonheme iron enzyme [Myxococcales bacterium]MBL0196620.1 SUMF1/EgtB/PvdO family nonheme iron enzyme [Myxococcales bacterium]HQY60318.1 SUMF1/EgtB/PvdO family nonheme iron enzyme [Polyangiaceae bacterium]
MRSRGAVSVVALACAAVLGGPEPWAHAGLASWTTALPEAPAARAERRGVVILAVPVSPRVRIPGGRFLMGSSPVEMKLAQISCQTEILRDRCSEIAFLFRAEGQLHEVHLTPYDLDRSEVTVADFGRCVAAGRCARPGFEASDARFARPRLPVTHVSWEAASTYCAFAGGRLPTEAEWEFAARGPEGRRYPWGRVWNPHLANHGAFAPDPTDATDGFVGLAEVGSFPDGATPQGVLDLAGNAGEWVSDFYDIDGNGHGYSGAEETNPKGPATGGRHVVRGGSFREGPAFLRGAARGTTLLHQSPEVGFRCAYDVGAPPAPAPRLTRAK